MNYLEINASLREGTGKGVARKLRADGKIPGVVYGLGINPISITLDTKEVSDAIALGQALRSVVTLKVEGRADLAKKVMMFKDIQRHHITRIPLAADLILIDPEKPLELEVPLYTTGTPVGEKLGGILQQIERRILVSAKLDKLPDDLSVDVTDMNPGDTRYIEDVELPEGVTPLCAPQTAVATLAIPRDYEEEEAEAEEGEEGAEGEEAAEGAAAESDSGEEKSGE